VSFGKGQKIASAGFCPNSHSFTIRSRKVAFDVAALLLLMAV